jgi:hypothetical protein
MTGPDLPRPHFTLSACLPKPCNNPHFRISAPRPNLGTRNMVSTMVLVSPRSFDTKTRSSVAQACRRRYFSSCERRHVDRHLFSRSGTPLFLQLTAARSVAPRLSGVHHPGNPLGCCSSTGESCGESDDRIQLPARPPRLFRVNNGRVGNF